MKLLPPFLRRRSNTRRRNTKNKINKKKTKKTKSKPVDNVMDEHQVLRVQMDMDEGDVADTEYPVVTTNITATKHQGGIPMNIFVIHPVRNMDDGDNNNYDRANCTNQLQPLSLPRPEVLDDISRSFKRIGDALMLIAFLMMFTMSEKMTSVTQTCHCLLRSINVSVDEGASPYHNETVPHL